MLPLWRRFAEILRAHGYSAWAGVLEAERYGVPQTRERAILMAHRSRHVEPPRATHQRYVKGEPARAEHTLEGGEILPWVSMAQALGWGMTQRPSVTVAAKPSRKGGRRGLAAGTGATRILSNERACGAFVTDTGNTRSGTRTEGRSRAAREPAPVVTQRADQLEWREYPPADWIHERPATTVAGDPRVHPPGHKINAQDVAAGRTDYDGRRGEHAVRVTVEEAAALQSFPPDHPWRGNRGQQFTQVGNAIPPLLARAILAELVG